MSEMVERVAKAINELAWENGPYPTYPEGLEERRAFLLRMARDAIAAMREPTEAMIIAGVQTHEGVTYSGIPSWEAMIDAAIADKAP